MNRADVRVAAWLAIAGLLVQIPALLWGVPGGKAINNALRILHGDVPYRDFWTMYAPGHFYLAAALFKVFGVHVWIQGVAAHALLAADAALVFLIGRRLGLPRRQAAIAGAAFVAFNWGQRELTSYEPAVLLILIAWACAIEYSRNRRPRLLWAAGLLLGAAAWFKHDVAFYAATAAGAGLAAGARAARGTGGWTSPAGALCAVGIGSLAVVLPAAAWLWLEAGRDAWRDLIEFPAGDFRVVRAEGYPPLLPDWGRVRPWMADPFNVEAARGAARHLSIWIQANLAQAALLAGVVAVVRRRRRLSPEAWTAAAMALFAMFWFWASAHVQHNTNFTSIWICAVLLGALAWPRSARRTRSVMAGAFALGTGALLVQPAEQLGEMAYFWKNRQRLELPALGSVVLPKWQHDVYHPIIALIRARVPESEPVYVGLARHDAVVVSNQSFYYLSGRGIPTRYNELHPGIVDREGVQREIIADLERRRVRYAVLWEFGWPERTMDEILARRRAAIPEIGATVLDEYLAREFAEVARHGEYVVVARRDREGGDGSP